MSGKGIFGVAEKKRDYSEFSFRNRLLLIAIALLVVACAPQPTGPTTPARAPAKTVVGPNGSVTPTIDVDGTYLVGLSITDIQMGTYRNAGGTDCYWARLRSLDPSDVIESSNSTSPQEVVLRASDTAFLTKNCGTWQMIGL